MATWTDGAAYAPIERPDGFAMPEAEPLPVAPRFVAPTPGAVAPPRGFAPTGPAIPLEQLHVTPPASRNPGEPFAVSAAMLTAGSAFRDATATRDPRAPFVSSSPVGTETLPPPTGDPLPPPTGAPLAGPGQLPPGSYPPPGEAPMWGPPLTPAGPDASQRSLVLLALVSLAFGVLVPVSSGWMLVVAGLLTSRAVQVTGGMWKWALGLGGLLALTQMANDSDGWYKLGVMMTVGFAVFSLHSLLRAR